MGPNALDELCQVIEFEIEAMQHIIIEENNEYLK